MAQHLRRALVRESGMEVQPRNFIVTEDLRKALKWALHKEPRRKGTGPDGIFSEALLVTSDLSHQILVAEVPK